MAAVQADIGLVLGGETGARLSRWLTMPVSGDTMLRLVRRRGIAPGPPPQVIGIDDCPAGRRGVQARRTRPTVLPDRPKPLR